MYDPGQCNSLQSFLRNKQLNIEQGTLNLEMFYKPNKRGRFSS